MAYTDTATLNYRGELFLIGNYATPFMSMIGGLNTGKRSTAFAFPLAQPWNLNAASQDVQSETTAAAAGTPTTYTRGQDTNVCQIMKPDAAVTFKKQSTMGSISGINTEEGQPVRNELTFQKEAAFRQLAINIEYSFINGVYVAESVPGTDVATRGILTAVNAGTNTVAAAGATLDKDLIDELMREMATNGSVFDNPVIFCNAFQKQKFSDLGYEPDSRTVGGLNITTYITDFATMGIVYTPQMPTDDLLIADLSVCTPVFVPVRFDAEDFVMDSEAGGDVIWVPTAMTAAKKGGFYYTQIGLDYGPEEYHGSITGLATS